MRLTWIRGAALVAGVALALLPAGCGGGGGDSDTSSATNAARAYVEASNQRDFPRLCNVLSDTYKLQLHMGSRCVGYLQLQTLHSGKPSLTLQGVTENGDAAVARITGTVQGQEGTAQSSLQVQLVKEDGEWKVTHLGGSVNY